MLVHPALSWVMVQLQGKGTPSNARQRALFVVSGCSKGPSFDIAAKRDLMELGLQILNHHSLGGKQSDLEAIENSHAKSRFST